MRKISCFLLILVLTLSLSMRVFGAERSIFTDPTGYTSAGDVDYVIVDGTVVNWGARGEDATFLSTYAESYYTGDYTWDILSALSGGTGTADAYESDLYEALRDMMVAKNHTILTYQQTRPYYQYTDCVSGNYSQLSSFYSGKMVNGVWDSGKTYNREHTWPNSKGLGGSDEDDIMMLRPTISSENSSRGNKAYGESSGYFDPGADVHGDCARILLYTYVRWGNTGKMWGTSGVMENLDILLKWMEEDPVDTWEMGRNDAVESITGVRNVFVDYPEYAWLIFGQEVPENMVTPSGMAAREDACQHTNTQLQDQKDATCTSEGYTGDTYCADCHVLIAAGSDIPATGHPFTEWISAPGGGSQSRWCQVCGYEETVELPPCPHENTQTNAAVMPTCVTDGYTGDTLCLDCGCFVVIGEALPATGEHTLDENGCCLHCDYTEAECSHENTERRGQKAATCAEEGYDGDVYCADCGERISTGSVIPATGHQFSEWVTAPGGGSQSRWCSVCNQEQTEPSPAPTPAPPLNTLGIVLVAVVLVILAGGATAIVIIKKKTA